MRLYNGNGVGHNMTNLKDKNIDMKSEMKQKKL